MASQELAKLTLPSCPEPCSTSWPKAGQAVAVVKAAAAANEVRRMMFSLVICERCARVRAGPPSRQILRVAGAIRNVGRSMSGLNTGGFAPSNNF